MRHDRAQALASRIALALLPDRFVYLLLLRRQVKIHPGDLESGNEKGGIKYDRLGG